MAGDYGHFAKELEPGAIEFLARLSLAPGTQLLDVGCGAGQTAIRAARAGAQVTGVDIAVNLVGQARAKAKAEGLNVLFEEGDAEALAYADGSFDVVISLIGAMFAPRPDRVAAELIRVCRSGGRIVMANWTAEGFVGQMFKTIGKHLPSPPQMPSPLLWGNETAVRERLREGIADLQMTRYHYPFHYPFGPAEVVEHSRTYFGPVNRAFAALGVAGQTVLRQDLEQLLKQHNLAKDGTTRYAAEYLEVSATRG